MCKKVAFLVCKYKISADRANIEAVSGILKLEDPDF